jgi:hypothetical protein
VRGQRGAGEQNGGEGGNRTHIQHSSNPKRRRREKHSGRNEFQCNLMVFGRRGEAQGIPGGGRQNSPSKTPSHQECRYPSALPGAPGRCTARVHCSRGAGGLGPGHAMLRARQRRQLLVVDGAHGVDRTCMTPHEAGVLPGLSQPPNIPAAPASCRQVSGGLGGWRLARLTDGWTVLAG